MNLYQVLIHRDEQESETPETHYITASSKEITHRLMTEALKYTTPYDFIEITEIGSVLG